MNENPVGVTGTMTLLNSTRSEITSVVITRCNDRTFSPRRNDESLRSGQRYTFTLLPGCWNMRIGDRAARQSFAVFAGQDLLIDYRGN